MSTNVKPLQGRHRAAVESRSAFPAALPMLLGGVALLLLAALVAWQVV